MKKLLLTLTIVMALLMQGCNYVERIEEAIADTQEVSATASKEADLFTDTVAALRTELAENQTLTERQRLVMENNLTIFSTKLDSALDIVAKADTQLVDLQTALEKAKTQSVPEQMETGGNYLQNLAATALPPGVREYVALFGMIVGSVGVGLQRREKKNTATEKTKRTDSEAVVVDLVRSVEELLSNGDVENVKTAKRTLATMQDTKTREAVRKVKSLAA